MLPGTTVSPYSASTVPVRVYSARAEAKEVGLLESRIFGVTEFVTL